MTEKQNNVVILQNPITRKGSDVKEVTITGALKQAGSLRGLKVYDVMTSDVDSLLTLLPRVTSPALTKEELMAMDTWDFCQLSNAVATFLQPSSLANETGAVTA
ncbi:MULTISPECIES: phage tail assembly protein [Pectobacterium]|uniref:phage tail assembly protein n=1 Tax=Pectobacterium TaxID=122277 RepID=UPI000EB583B5|nr:phage tail assembly protein [Pectobacterium parmentieri]AYH25837.1 phage tail protein [Pectobacterium parmentieri]